MCMQNLNFVALPIPEIIGAKLMAKLATVEVNTDKSVSPTSVH